MIMLGAFIKKSGLASFDTMLHVVKDIFGDRNPGVFKSNKAALQLGFDYLK
jgi:Pyruvate/2-oxoacid:ferredoxin oxidoreductase gamma subunit